jgi:hypothetical protein
MNPLARTFSPEWTADEAGRERAAAKLLELRQALTTDSGAPLPARSTL